MHFRVELTMYRGPVDLLLYLVRKHEVEIIDLPIAKITEQYLDYLTVLEQIDVNDVGDFLEMASLLIEIKARMVLPQTVETGDEEPAVEDPREELVERLLEYKRYKDVASILEERGRRWQQSYPRLANDLPPRQVDPADQPIHEVELWDLVSALGRVMREHEQAQPPNIVYDDIPIQTHMRRLHGEIVQRGRVGITEVFRVGMHKAAMIGMFLAVLELVRHHSVEAEQEEGDGEIWVRPGPFFREQLDLDDIDTYEHGNHARESKQESGEPLSVTVGAADEDSADDADASILSIPQ